MTILSDIALRIAREVTDVLSGTAESGTNISLTDTANLWQPNQYWNNGTLFINSGTHQGKVIRDASYASNKLNFAPLPSVLCTLQVDTATVVGAIGAAGAGNAAVTFISALTGTKVLSVAVANNDTAAQVATKIRAALTADTDIAAYFTIGGASAAITITAKTALANDTTLNLAIDNDTCTGLTAAPASANTTAGVAGPRYALIRSVYPWPQIVSAIETALGMTHIETDNYTLTGDGVTLEFTLPTGVSDIKEVQFQRVDYYTRSFHWTEKPGKIRWDYGYPPIDGDIIHLIYRDVHPALTSPLDTINTAIDPDWLIAQGVKELLYWALGVYGNMPEYKLEERMGKAAEALKGKYPRLDAPDFQVRSSHF